VHGCGTACAENPRVFECPRGIAVAFSTHVRGSIQLGILVLLNLALQLFDGVATYVGWEQHGEMNPILRAGFDRFGAGPTLVAAKAMAILFVLVLAATPRRRLGMIGLAITLTAYTTLSFVPWAQRLFG
jgi:hypothetical protein